MSASRLRGFLASEYPPAAADAAAYHVIPAPMELSVSYGAGAARGPEAILAASQQLEAADRGVTLRGGIHTQAAVNPRRDTPRHWVDAVGAAVGAALEAGAVPLLLGGEHTVTLGAAEAFRRAGRRIGFIQFDAHADLRDQYERSPLSHACVMRRIHELGFPVLQLATRAYAVEEAEYRIRSGIPYHDAEALTSSRPRRLLPANFPAEVYVTFDVDALDPSAMPATGTPVAGGLFWREAAQLLDTIRRRHRIVGADVVELSPVRGLHHADFTAAQLAFRLMTLAARP